MALRLKVWAALGGPEWVDEMRLSHPFKAALIYFLCAAADILASIPKLPAGFHEANPFARHPDGSFWLQHACGNLAIFGAETLICSLIIYFALKIANRKLAEFAAALPWLYYAYGHLQGAAMNLQVKLLYVPFSAHNDVLEFLKQLVR